MFRKTWRTYLSTVIVLFGIDWFVGIVRYRWPIFKPLFAIINFPCSTGFLWLERKPNTWWHNVFGHRFEVVLNDEVGVGFAFIIMVLLQAMLITLLLQRTRTWWNVRHSSNIAVN